MKRAVLHGFLAGVALLTVYFLVMGFASGSWDYTASQLVSLRYWIGVLVLGFSIQVGLFSYLKNCHKETKLGQGAVVAGAGTSSLSMLACCAHHITDVLPFIGLSVLSLALARYQVWFLVLGIASNLVGIFLMARQLSKMKR